MSNYFKIDLEKCSCSVKDDNLNPIEMIELANRLRNNAIMLMQSKWNPADVMANTMRMKEGFITFRLAYNAPELSISLSDPKIPVPNVELSEDEYTAYEDLYHAVTS